MFSDFFTGLEFELIASEELHTDPIEQSRQLHFAFHPGMPFPARFFAAFFLDEAVELISQFLYFSLELCRNTHSLPLRSLIGFERHREKEIEVVKVVRIENFLN